MSIQAKPLHSVGVPMKRKEDPRFIQGKGNYVDDLSFPGMNAMDLFEQVAALRREGQSFALATVVGRRAPVSAHLGDRAIVFADGRMRRRSRHPSRRVAAPRRARPRRVRPAIKPQSRERARSSGMVWASAERSRGGADTPEGRRPAASGPRHRHDAVTAGTSRVCAGSGAQAGA